MDSSNEQREPLQQEADRRFSYERQDDISLPSDRHEDAHTHSHRPRDALLLSRPQEYALVPSDRQESTYLPSDRQDALSDSSSTATHGPDPTAAKPIHRVTGEEEKPRTKRPSWIYLWSLEILSIAFSLVCMIAIIVILRVLDGKPYERWSVLGTSLTPNTLLAILSTFSKSSLLMAVAEGISQLKWVHFQKKAHKLSELQVFDDASRGPLGAVKLLWTARTIVGSIGAVITILALGTDPFVQQVLSFPPKMSEMHNSTATIAVSRMINNLNKAEMNHASHNAFNGTEPQRRVAWQYPSVLESMLSPDLPPKFSCESGDCTWPPFETIAICSSCKDITDSVKRRCGDVVQNPIQWKNTTVNSMPCNYTTSFTSKNTTVWWTSGDLSTLSADKIPVAQSLASYITEVYPSIPWHFFDPKKVDSYFMDITNFRFPSDNLNGTSGWHNDIRNFVPPAHHCRARLCVQKYANTTFSGGILRNPLTSTDELTLDLNYRHHQAPTSDNGVDDFVAAYPASRPPSDPKWPNVTGSDAPYWIEANYLLQIAELIQLLFLTHHNATDITGAIKDPLENVIYSAGGGHFPTVLDNVFSGFSNRLRQDQNGQTVQGTARASISFVHVRWVWLIYPMVLPVFAAAFLITSMVISGHRTQRASWKSSTLALLFHDIDRGDVRRENVDNVRDMKKMAKGMWVRLKADEDDRMAFVQSK